MLLTFESKLRKAVNKAWLKKPVPRAELERLSDALVHFADRLDPAQPEEHAKNLLAELLKTTFYATGYEVNIQGKIGLTPDEIAIVEGRSPER